MINFVVVKAVYVFICTKFFICITSVTYALASYQVFKETNIKLLINKLIVS